VAKTTRTAEAKLELELALEADAPGGALLTTDGRRRAFTGWIELAAAIEDWRQAEDSDAR
jgi:hypothetical protein